MLNLQYPIGFPGWKLAARAGVPLRVRVHVLHDDEAGCYVATSPDLSGLVVEARSLDQLVEEVDECIGMLLHECMASGIKRPPVADLRYGLLTHCA